MSQYACPHCGTIPCECDMSDGARLSRCLDSNRQLREELERVKILALRIYPDLKASGICSAHHDDGHFECETCYGNWKELAIAHCDLKQKAWSALAAAKEALEYAQHRARLEYALTASEMPTIKTNYDNALARIAECEKKS